MLKANKATNQLRSSIREDSCSSKLMIRIKKTVFKKNTNENRYGKVHLCCEIGREVWGFVSKIRVTYTMISLLILLLHFDKNILQHDYSSIHNLSLFEVPILIIVVLSFNYLFSIVLGYQGPDIELRRWYRGFTILPFYADTLSLLTKIHLFTLKFKTHTKLFSVIKENETEKKEVIQETKNLINIQRRIEESDTRSRNTKMISSVFSSMAR